MLVLLYLISFAFVTCNGERIVYRKGNLILLNHIKEEDEYQIFHEGTNYSDFLIFQHDGVSSFLDIFFKLWNSVEVTIHCNDDEFKMKIRDNISQLLPSDKSHAHVSSLEHFQDAFQQFWDDINYFQGHKSVKLNPVGQHFIKLCYHGSKSFTAFSVAVNNAIDQKFPISFFAGMAMVVLAHPLSKKVKSLYQLCAFAVGIVCSPFTLVFMFSRRVPWVIVSYCVFTLGSLVVICIMYYLTQLTLDEFFHLPLVIIICAVILIQICFKPVTKFHDASKNLLRDKNFLWIICIGGRLLLVCSTQSWIASILLFTCSCIVSVLVERNVESNSRKNKMLDSQELEYATVVK